MTEIGKFIPKPKTKFLKAKCSSCGNEQIVFSAASTLVKCVACDHVIAKPSGSKVKLNVKEVKELN